MGVGSFSNSLTIGYPLATGLAEFAAMTPFPLALLKVLAGLFATVFKNPLILAILTVVVFSIFSIESAELAISFIDLLSRIVVELGLFVIGDE